MNRTTLTASLMLAVTFVLGGLAGMAIEEGFGLDWFDFLDEDSRPAETRLLGDLDFTDAQAEQIDRILEQQEDRLEDYWDARIPEMRAIVAESYEEIRGVLTAEQRATFDRRVQEGGIPVRLDDD